MYIVEIGGNLVAVWVTFHYAKLGNLFGGEFPGYGF
jgi:hypothetical protein